MHHACCMVGIRQTCSLRAERGKLLTWQALEPQRWLPCWEEMEVFGIVTQRITSREEVAIRAVRFKANAGCCFVVVSQIAVSLK